MNRLLFLPISVILLALAMPGQAEVLPDPTRPAAYQVTTVTQELPRELIDWKVTAIRISERDRSAIVNGKIVRTGETIGPARILEIQSTQVVLDYDNTMVAVRLFNDLTLRKPASN